MRPQLITLVLLLAVQHLHAEPQAAIPAGAGGATQPTREMVLQKQQLVKMLLGKSAALERAARSEDGAVRRQAEEARASLDKADAAISLGNMAPANDFLDEALRLIESAARQTPDVRQKEIVQRARYDELLKSVQSIQSTYLDIQRSLLPKAAAPSAELGRIGNQVGKAQKSARDGRYREAVELLNVAHASIIAALNQLLESTALVYDPKFKSAADEFDYELARYHSYEELAPIAYAELKPGDESIRLSERYVQESRAMRDTAKQQAAKGDHQSAIGTLMGAIKLMQAALRVVGLVLPE